MIQRPWRPGLCPHRDGDFDPQRRGKQKQKAGNSVEPAHRQPVWLLVDGSEYWIPAVYNREAPGFWVRQPGDVSKGWTRVPDEDVQRWGQR